MITCSNIAFGDQLGAQMSTFASLIYIAEKNKQELVFPDELKDFKRGYRFYKRFKGIKKIRLIREYHGHFPELYCRQFAKNEKTFAGGYKRIYKNKLCNIIDYYVYKVLMKVFYKDFQPVFRLKNDIHTDIALLNLDPQKNYDILSGRGTYQDWKEIEGKIRTFFSFYPEDQEFAEKWYKMNKKEGMPVVGIHFRKTDYLIMSSLNLGSDYYKRALQYFPADKWQLLIFSDDIESCKKNSEFSGYVTTFVYPHTDVRDMCIMSLCDANIIANSSFSFWGAMLGEKWDKPVICPHDFIGSSSPENMYMNGNWYPDRWTAI